MKLNYLVQLLGCFYLFLEVYMHKNLIHLKEKKNIEEVVVIGYGKQKQKKKKI